jgi:thiol-disulfide isomerase/thioredoxin
MRRIRDCVTGARFPAWLYGAGTAMVFAATLAAQQPEDSAPAFILKTLAGSPDSLSGYKGHPVLINFWATWCVPCRDEMPRLVVLYHEHQSAGLIILAINLTEQEISKKNVQHFVTEFQMPFPVLLDEKGKVFRRYKLHGLPTSVFIGADGVVRAVNPGPITAAALQQHLAEILPAQ